MSRRFLVSLVVLSVAALCVLGCGGAMKAEHQLHQENYQEAITLYKAHVTDHPDSIRARSKLGFAYLKTGRLDEAVSEFETVLARKPGEPYATLYLGITYLNKEEPGKTIEIWQRYRDRQNPLIEDEIRRLLTLVQMFESQRQAKRALAEEATLSTMKPQTNTVAVCYYQDRSSDQSLRAFQKGLAAMVVSDLSKIRALDVIERLRLQALLAEMELGQTGIVDERTAPRIGRLLGAENLIFGNLVQGSIQVATTLASTGGGGVKGTAAAAVDVDRFYELPATIVRQVAEILDIELSPEESEAIGRPHTTQYEAFICYGQGLDALDAGQWQEAKNLFDRAVKIDPNFKLAANAAASCPGPSSPSPGQLGNTPCKDIASLAESAVGAAADAQGSAAGEGGGGDGGGDGGGCY